MDKEGPANGILRENYIIVDEDETTVYEVVNKMVSAICNEHPDTVILPDSLIDSNTIDDARMGLSSVNPEGIKSSNDVRVDQSAISIVISAHDDKQPDVGERSTTAQMALSDFINRIDMTESLVSEEDPQRDSIAAILSDMVGSVSANIDNVSDSLVHSEIIHEANRINMTNCMSERTTKMSDELDTVNIYNPDDIHQLAVKADADIAIIDDSNEQSLANNNIVEGKECFHLDQDINDIVPDSKDYTIENTLFKENSAEFHAEATYISAKIDVVLPGNEDVVLRSSNKRTENAIQIQHNDCTSEPGKDIEQTQGNEDALPVSCLQDARLSNSISILDTFRFSYDDRAQELEKLSELRHLDDTKIEAIKASLAMQHPRNWTKDSHGYNAQLEDRHKVSKYIDRNPIVSNAEVINDDPSESVAVRSKESSPLIPIQLLPRSTEPKGECSDDTALSPTVDDNNEGNVKPLNEKKKIVKKVDQKPQRVKDLSERPSQEAKVEPIQGFKSPMCRSLVFPPSETSKHEDDPSPPTERLSLDHIYGYNGSYLRSKSYQDVERTCRPSSLITTNDGYVIYPAATVVVIAKHNSKTQRYFRLHSNVVTCLCLHPDNRTVASYESEGPGRLRGTILIWNMQSALSDELTADSPSIISLSLNQAIEESFDRSRQLLFPLANHQTMVMSLDFCHDGRLLLSLTSNQLVIFDWRKGQVVYSSEMNHSKVTSMRFNPYLYHANDDETENRSQEETAVDESKSHASRTIREMNYPRRSGKRILQSYSLVSIGGDTVKFWVFYVISTCHIIQPIVLPSTASDKSKSAQRKNGIKTKKDNKKSSLAPADSKESDKVLANEMQYKQYMSYDMTEISRSIPKNEIFLKEQSSQERDIRWTDFECLPSIIRHDSKDNVDDDMKIQSNMIITSTNHGSIFIWEHSLHYDCSSGLHSGSKLSLRDRLKDLPIKATCSLITAIVDVHSTPISRIRYSQDYPYDHSKISRDAIDRKAHDNERTTRTDVQQREKGDDSPLDGSFDISEHLITCGLDGSIRFWDIHRSDRSFSLMPSQSHQELIVPDAFCELNVHESMTDGLTNEHTKEKHEIDVVVDISQYNHSLGCIILATSACELLKVYLTLSKEENSNESTPTGYDSNNGDVPVPSFEMIASGSPGMISHVTKHPCNPSIFAYLMKKESSEHMDHVYALNKSIVTGSDGVIMIWDLSKNAIITKVKIPSWNITCFSFVSSSVMSRDADSSDDGNIGMIMGNDKGEILLIDIDTENTSHLSSSDKSKHNKANAYGSYRIIAKKCIATRQVSEKSKGTRGQGSIKTNKTTKKSHKDKQSLSQNDLSINFMKFSADGSLFIIACDRQIHILSSLNSFKRVSVCRSHQHTVRISSVDVSVDNQYIQASDVSCQEILYFEVSSGDIISDGYLMRDVEWATWTSPYGYSLLGLLSDESLDHLYEKESSYAKSKSKHSTSMQNMSKKGITSTTNSNLNISYGSHALPSIDKSDANTMIPMKVSDSKKLVIMGDNIVQRQIWSNLDDESCSFSKLKLYRYPCVLEATPKEYLGHGKAITSVECMADDTVLLSAAADGCVFKWKVSND